MSETPKRPTRLTPELITEICDTISNTSLGLKKLCAKNLHWPAAQTIRDAIQTHETFSVHYARAKLKQADYMAEEIIEIADDGSNDFMQEEGKERLDGEHVQRSRLRVDTRKWLSSKLAPKVYGDMARTSLDVSDSALMTKIIDKL